MREQIKENARTWIAINGSATGLGGAAKHMINLLLIIDQLEQELAEAKGESP